MKNVKSCCWHFSPSPRARTIRVKSNTAILSRHTFMRFGEEKRWKPKENHFKISLPFVRFYSTSVSVLRINFRLNLETRFGKANEQNSEHDVSPSSARNKLIAMIPLVDWHGVESKSEPKYDRSSVVRALANDSKTLASPMHTQHNEKSAHHARYRIAIAMKQKERIRSTADARSRSGKKRTKWGGKGRARKKQP